MANRKNRKATVAQDQAAPQATPAAQDHAAPQATPAAQETPAPKASGPKYNRKKIQYAFDDVITVLVPQAKGIDGKSDSANRYNLLVTGMTVQEYVNACTQLTDTKNGKPVKPSLATSDLSWNAKRAYIRVDAKAANGKDA